MARPGSGNTSLLRPFLQLVLMTDDTKMRELFDPCPGASSAHRIEARRGWKTLGGLSVEKVGDEWYVYSLYTKPEHRGEGVSKALLAHVEKEYGTPIVSSENDPFWSKMGYVQQGDGYWRKQSRLKFIRGGACKKKL